MRDAHRLALATTALLAATPAAHAGHIETSPYGTTADGKQVDLYTLTNDRGMTVKFMAYGGIITEIDVPDRDGQVGNVVLGFPTLADYVAKNGNIHFGALIGRYANRIGGARFSLDGQEYRLDPNDHGNTLHGGTDGYDRRVWAVRPKDDGTAATLLLTSPDGDQHFPGTLKLAVTYTLTDEDELRIDYQATTDKDTVVNFTNHTYFNLAGNGSGPVTDHILQVHASHYTPVNGTMIPTGEIAPVDGTPLDFRQPVPIGARLTSGFAQMVAAHGYDHNWILDKPQGDPMPLAARVYDPRSGRIVEVRTTEPGLQVYTGNFLDGSAVGSAGTTYRQTAALTLETQHYPDSPNQPGFPTTELKPGQTFRSTTVFRFSTDSRPVSSVK